MTEATYTHYKFNSGYQEAAADSRLLCGRTKDRR